MAGSHQAKWRQLSNPLCQRPRCQPLKHPLGSSFEVLVVDLGQETQPGYKPSRQLEAAGPFKSPASNKLATSMVCNSCKLSANWLSFQTFRSSFRTLLPGGRTTLIALGMSQICFVIVRQELDATLDKPTGRKKTTQSLTQVEAVGWQLALRLLLLGPGIGRIELLPPNPMRQALRQLQVDHRVRSCGQSAAGRPCRPYARHPQSGL